MNRSNAGDRERGAVLVLALVFLVAVGLVLASLVSLTGTNLADTSNLQHQRDTEFAADAAIDGAIDVLRTPASPAVTCPTPLGQPVTVGAVSMAVKCSSATPPGASGRIVEFDACSSSLTTFTACQGAAVIRAEVTYDDQGGVGSGMDVWSWVVDPASA